jgi:probable HAF family extracellular repeat protein
MFVVSLLVSLVIVQNAHGAAQYTVIDLGDYSANGINSSGKVVGVSTTNGHAFRYDRGAFTDLGTLPGYWYSEGNDINADGVIAGLVNSGSSARGFVYSNHTMTMLGTLGGSQSWANAINDSGQIAGSAELPSGFGHASIFSNGTVTDLGTLQNGIGNSDAYDINASGQVVGYSNTTNGSMHAFLYSNGKMNDLGTLPDYSLYSYANSINDNGQVVGASFKSMNQDVHAFLWVNNAMTDLGTLGGINSNAIAINNKGQVVGTARTSSGSIHAFIYENGVMRDLNVLASFSGTLWSATGINDNGQIIATGVTSTGMQHAFLLNPVPEPSTVALLLTATVGGLLLWHRGRRVAEVLNR